MPYITGTTNAEDLTGTTGDDYFDSLGGNDIVDGGDGNDALLIYDEARWYDISTLAGVTKVLASSNAKVTYRYDTTTLTNVEQIQFTDQTVYLNTDSYTITSGTTNAEDLTGTTGDDYFDSLGGNDIVDGGDGNDALSQ